MADLNRWAPPRNYTTPPPPPFVAGFVGDNNTWQGRARKHGDSVLITTAEGFAFEVRGTDRSTPNIPGEDCPVTLFLRPEAMSIDPGDKTGLNVFDVTVKSILFDGANSRLLTTTQQGHELLVALPQNREFDHIRPGDGIPLGWRPESGIIFRSED